MATNIAENCDVGGAGPVCYACGEENIEQIGNRANRLTIKAKDLLLYSSTDVKDYLKKMQLHSPRAVVVDSIQTMYLKGVTGSRGGSVQLKACTSELLCFAKETNTPVIVDDDQAFTALQELLRLTTFKVQVGPAKALSINNILQLEVKNVVFDGEDGNPSKNESVQKVVQEVAATSQECKGVMSNTFIHCVINDTIAPIDITQEVALASQECQAVHLQMKLVPHLRFFHKTSKE